MNHRLLSATLAAGALLAFAAPAHAADTFTVSAPPQVGVTLTVDATAVVPPGASVTASVQWRSPGCCGAVHVIRQLGREAVTTWTPSPLDATHGFITIVVDVGVPNAVNHLVRHTVYAASYVVQAVGVAP